MFLDYLIVPLINTIYGSLTLERMFPGVPYAVWAVLFVAIITFLNLRGIRAVARANIILLAVMTAVIVAFVVLAAPLPGPRRRLGTRVLLQTLLQPGNLRSESRCHGHVPGGADVHRL